MVVLQVIAIIAILLVILCLFFVGLDIIREALREIVSLRAPRLWHALGPIFLIPGIVLVGMCVRDEMNKPWPKLQDVRAEANTVCKSMDVRAGPTPEAGSIPVGGVVPAEGDGPGYFYPGDLWRDLPDSIRPERPEDAEYFLCMRAHEGDVLAQYAERFQLYGGKRAVAIHRTFDVWLADRASHNLYYLGNIDGSREAPEQVTGDWYSPQPNREIVERLRAAFGLGQ